MCITNRAMVLQFVIAAWACTAWADESTPLVPLVVDNPWNWNVQEIPVTTGIPLPRDLDLLSTDHLNIVDGGGQTVPSQFTVTARWGGSVDDQAQPIKWILATFPVHVPALESRTYTLTCGEPNNTDPGLSILENDATHMLIDTGVAQFTLNKQAFSLMDRVVVRGTAVTESLENGLVLVDEQGVEYASRHAALDVIRILEQGPIRLCILCEGTLCSAEGAPGLDYRVIFHFFSNASFVKLFITLGNHEQAMYDGIYDVYHFGGANSFSFQSFGACLRLQPQGGAIHAACPLADGMATANVSDAFRVIQDSSGTDFWDAYDASDHPRPNSFPQFRGYQVWNGSTLVQNGDHYPGWLGASHAQASITAGVRDFWQLFPKSLIAQQDGGLHIQLFPEAHAGLFNFRVGEEKTHELFCLFHDGDAAAANAAQLAENLNHPLQAMPPASWFLDSEVLPGFALEPQPAVARHGQAHVLDDMGLYAYLNDRVLKADPLYQGPYSYYYDYHSLWESSPDSPSSVDYFNFYGWSWYGNQPLDFEAFASNKAGPFNGKYNLDYGAWIQYLRTGDARWRDMAEAFSRASERFMLHDVLTQTGYDIWRWKNAVFGHSQHNETGNLNGERNGLGPVTDTTFGAQGARLHYYLTGNDASRRFLEKSGEHMFMFYSDAYYSSSRFLSVPFLGNSVEREYANAITTLVEAFGYSGDLSYAQLIQDMMDHFAPVCQPWIHGPIAGATGYVSSWQLIHYIAALGRFAQVAGEFGLTPTADAASSQVVDFVNWLLTHATRQYDGIFSIYYSWNLNGDNDPDDTGMINNWMLLMADVCAYAYRFTHRRVYMVYGAEFFATAVHDPAYVGDAPTYTSVKEAANQMSFGHIYMHEAGDLDPLPSDGAAPQIEMLTPTQGQTLSGHMDVEVLATDDVGVMQVVFTMDSEVVGASYTPPFSFNFDTRRVDNGSHVLQATAHDFSWNQTASSPVTLNIENTVDQTPPTCVLTQPLSGAQVSGTVSLSAQATDDTGVRDVQFFVDNSLVGTDSQSPYALPWNTADWGAGTHDLQATATDLSGNATTSAVVQVECVHNQAPVPVVAVAPAFIQVMTEVTLNAGASWDPDGDTLSFIWDLGDGFQAQGPVVQHTYTQAGEYDVNLTVGDGIESSVITLNIHAFPLGELMVADIPVMQDATIHWGGGPYGADPELHVYNGLNPDYRALLKFDLSGWTLPENAQIVRAQVCLHATFVQSTPIQQVFPMTRAWDEQQVTWFQADNQTPWQTEGGDFDAAACMVETEVLEPGSANLDITSRFLEWVSGAADNHGLLITSPESQAYVWTTYDSREADEETHRPRLQITCLRPEMGPLSAQILPSTGCQGLEPMAFSLAIENASSEVTVSWTVAPHVDHATQDGGRELVFEEIPSARTTQIQALVMDTRTRESVTTSALALTAAHAVFFDFNGDQHNDLADLWALAPGWAGPMAPDPNDDGWIDVRDLLFIHVDADRPGPHSGGR